MPSLRSMASSGSLRLKKAASDVRHRANSSASSLAGSLMASASLLNLHDPNVNVPFDVPDEPVPPIPAVHMAPSASTDTFVSGTLIDDDDDEPVTPTPFSTTTTTTTTTDASSSSGSFTFPKRPASAAPKPSAAGGTAASRRTMPHSASGSLLTNPVVAHRNARAISEVNETVYSFRLLEALRNGDQTELHPFLSKNSVRSGPIKELTSPLHLAVRCAEYKTIELCLEYKSAMLNAPESLNGNTPLHLASSIGRPDVVELFLEQDDVDDTIRNNEGKEPMDLAKTFEIAQIFQVSRARLNLRFLETLEAWESGRGGPEELYILLSRPRVSAIDLNAQTHNTGTTILHEAVRRKDTRMIETSVRMGADVFCRNRKGRRALESTKDEKIKALLQQLSNADAARAVQGNQSGLPPIFRGYLAKWTNLAGGYKTRWFVLENGILSYYHTQEEEGKQSRGSTNLRFAKIRADNNDKHRFEVISDASRGSASKLFLRGSHPVERARWVQILQQTVDYFDIERAPSRAESIAGSVRFGSTTSLLDSASATSHVPAGTKNVPGTVPFSVPSRTGTPFRGLSSMPTEQPIPELAAPTPIRPNSTLLDPSSGSQKAPSARSSGSRPYGGTPSIGSHEDTEHDLSNEDQHDADGNPRGLPYQGQIEIIANSLKTQVELAQNLAQSLNSVPSTPVVPAAPPVNGSRISSTGSRMTFQASSENVRDALQDALQNSATLLLRYQDVVAQREAYLLRRYEQEIQAKHLWEENMKILGAQHADMEQQLREAHEENARRRKALREVRNTFANSPAGTLSSPPATTGNRALSQDMFKTPQGSIAARRAGEPDAASPLRFDDGLPSTLPGNISAIAGCEDLLNDADNAEDLDDEFFDAIDANNLPGLVVERQLQPESKAQSPDYDASKSFPKDMDTKQIDLTLYEPYKRLRKQLPIGADERPSVSLWAVLKNNIGKDLTKISFPVAFNEPTSMLQRMAEDLEFPEVLEAACEQTDSLKRIAFVAAFAASNYSSTIGRIAKPFNPILGETFEYCSLGAHPFRYVSEQVSHHPPKSACLAQGPAWEYMGSVDAKSRFTGRSFEIQPTGVAHVNLKLPEAFCANAKKPLPAAGGLYKEGRVVEHYSWSKVTTVVSGFLTGSVSIDHVGTLAVKNHATGERCELTFKPRGWRGANACEIRGAVYTADGEVALDIAGRWSSQLVARKRGAGTGELNPDQDVGGTGAEYVLLWRNNPKPPAAFNLTSFAATLNSLPDGLQEQLPPTDCRLRPDLSAFESGRFSEADVLKGKLEEVQRATRRKREAGELAPHKPRWFREVVEPETGESMYEAISAASSIVPGESEAEYWVQRYNVAKEKKAGNAKADWPGVVHIFGDLEARRGKV